jgi:hypothetical protein
MRTFLAGICALAVFGSAASVSAIPPDQRIEIRFHSSPGDPNSAVEMTAVLYLTAESGSGSTVGWKINQAEFSRPNGDGFDRWIKSNLTNLDSTDGLWWVHHHDPDDPDISEFSTLPAITGEASGTGHGQAALSFDLAPGEISSSTVTYAHAAYATFSFQVDDEEEPVDGDDEPVEVDHEPTVG